MTSGGARVGVGTRFTYDGETVEVVEMKPSAAGNEVVVRSVTGQSYRRLPLKELLFSDRARLIPDMAGPSSDDTEELAAVVLAELTEFERQDVCERAGRVKS